MIALYCKFENNNNYFLHSEHLKIKMVVFHLWYYSTTTIYYVCSTTFSWKLPIQPSGNGLQALPSTNILSVTASSKVMGLPTPFWEIIMGLPILRSVIKRALKNKLLGNYLLHGFERNTLSPPFTRLKCLVILKTYACLAIFLLL